MAAPDQLLAVIYLADAVGQILHVEDLEAVRAGTAVVAHDITIILVRFGFAPGSAGNRSCLISGDSRSCRVGNVDPISTALRTRDRIFFVLALLHPAPT